MSVVFKAKKVADEQKLRGGYYTPESLSSFLCAWAIRNNYERILEPSCGDGNFLMSAKRVFEEKSLKHGRITALEILKSEIDIAKERFNLSGKNCHSVKWINSDFFLAYADLKKQSFDVVVGNPPFIRFQYFEEKSRDIAFSHLRDAGYKPNKLANTWAAFVQLSIELLEPGGRLAMVLPAELLQVKYAGELRERITQSFDHVALVTFKRLVFKEIQQEIILVLAEGKRDAYENECDLHTVEIADEKELNTKTLDNIVSHKRAKHARVGVKWTSLFLSNEQFEAVDNAQKNKKLTSLGEIASVDVGIVTGRNNYFVVSNSVRNDHELEKFVIPLVGKTNALKSLIFDESKLSAFALQNSANLLSLKGVERGQFSKGLERYIALGEKEGVHQGYKCRIRKRWFDVPSVHISDGFLFRQIHRFPLLVSNLAKAACTDTIHRVTLLDKAIDFSQLAASFVNSLTFAWSEVCGRSYGGGVLELEPNEAEELPVPFFPEVDLDVNYISRCLEEGNVEGALDYTDNVLLVKCLGFSKHEVSLLREAWSTLRDRRIGRK